MPLMMKYNCHWSKLLENGVKLTPRQREFVELKASGLSTRQTGEKMNLSRRRIWDIQRAIFEKYGEEYGDNGPVLTKMVPYRKSEKKALQEQILK